MQDFFDRVNTYTTLSAESRAALEKTLQKKTYKKNEFFLSEGDIPKKVAFVSKGLFSQYYTTDNGDIIIKRFFPEHFFVASTSAMLQRSPSLFTIKALETSQVWEYPFAGFKQMITQYPDIAAFYIRYMELHWIIEKEPLEISLRHDLAKDRYLNFRKTYPMLEDRLKQHEVASYLGITPTQLSRIKASL